MQSNKSAIKRAIVWFRSDLRTIDNPALYNACKECDEVIGLYISVPRQWDEHHIGDNKRWFIGENVKCLKQALSSMNIPLIELNGTDYKACSSQIKALTQQLLVNNVYFNRELEINELERDNNASRVLQGIGVSVSTYNDQTLQAPGSVLTKNGDYFKVFTPFKNAFTRSLQPEHLEVLPIPKKQSPLEQGLLNLVSQLSTPISSPEKTCESIWNAGEVAAQGLLDNFTDSAINNYHLDRDMPSINQGTSRLSAYLSVGAISPKQCFKQASDIRQTNAESEQGSTTWINEIIWREFYKHIVVGFPNVCKGYAFNRNYQFIPWRKASQDFNAWCEGRTGYPLVDAAMKQLVTEGWMHNRLRMVTAMFLTKHLLIDWRCGEMFFLEHLIDADFSANNGGWQWSASTGADAAPYFRIFNPIRQSERFDKEGSFIKRYLPELASLPPKSIHLPTEIEALANNYPTPIVDHKMATARAKTTYKIALEQYAHYQADSAMEHAL